MQRDFLNYTAHKIKFDLLENDKNGCNSLRLMLRTGGTRFGKEIHGALICIIKYFPKLEYIPARSAGGHRNPAQDRWSLAGIVEYKYSLIS